MQRVVIGTAGHIDHGKTRLIEALTGIDCDRWAEEKARGITIDLGFAHLEEGDLQLGFVDVPGHERFLHNALAGLGGIRVMLLVIAADEGVKPQTREHLAICSLLAIPHGVVALTKCDLVDRDLRELAQLEVEELLASTPFAGAPVVPVSSTTGEGVPALRATLVELARRIASPARDDAPFRLPIDRAFQLRGLGAIVTGTLISGGVSPGDVLRLLPGEETAKVRSVQVHGRERERAVAGERTALQLVGVDLASLERGEQLTAPGAFAATRTLCARFTLLADAPAPLTDNNRKGGVPARFHLYSSEVVGKVRALGPTPIAPGETGWVEVRLSSPVVAVRGDRFVVRRPSPAATLGGGEVVDPLWRRRRGASLAAALAAIAAPERALELWVSETGERGATVEELRPRLGGTAAALERDLAALVKDGRLLRVDAGRGRRWIAPAAYDRVRERARQALRRYFTADRLARGMPKAQLLNETLPRRAADLGDVYLTWLAAEKLLTVDGDLVNLPGRTAQLSGEESQLSRDFLAAVEAGGLTPPSPQEIGRNLGAKPQILEGVQKFLVERGRLVRLPGGLILATAAIERLRQELASTGWDRFTVAQFKERYDLSRKWAIPLLEHLDSTGATRRIGDERQIVRR